VEETIESRGDMAASAATYLANNLLGVGAGNRFEVRATGTQHNGQPFLRMKQMHEGLEVFGAEVIVNANNAAFSSANGQVLRFPGLSTTPSVAKAKALEIAKGLYLGKVVDRTAKIEYSRESTTLKILPREGQAPRLAWHTAFYTEAQAGVEPKFLHVFVDAQDGSILQSHNAIHTLSQASGPGGNLKVPRTWTNALDVEPSGAQFMMDTARLRTVNMNNGTSGGTTVVGPLSPIGDAPINDAHGYAEATLNMLLDWQGENSINGAGFKILSRVHYSSNYENAFWDGSQMTYGDGASTFYPLSGGLDVVSHEMNHGYTTFHSNLTYSGQSGGVNESFSDISGEVAEAYLDQAAPDMLVGADIYKAANGALRYMCNPTQDGRSIDNLANFTTGIDVHLSSGIMNKAFCRSSARLASGSPTGAHTMASVQRASRAWYLANKSKWTASSNFTSACTGVWNAATDLGFTTAEKCAIRDSWIDVGVTCGDATLCGGTPPPPPPPGNSYAYSATNTNSAQQNTVNQTVALTAG
ncbi:MAG TPA: M4 family metallopeptidase, partial [Kofleriaceae bacterium]|nr:M4 family metallopeptidase [Kofleriaceae bacterium]